jgi:nicotinate phosphoribosyltransferase
MGELSTVYRTSLALLTDLYQLTMAYGYWKLGRADQEAAFHLFFRDAPFGGSYAVAAGLERALDLVADYRFESSDIEYLAGLSGADGQTLFDPGFLEYLQNLKLTCHVDAMPEGTVAFAREPLVRVTGPILQCQLLETPLLTMINFQTLIATKAARMALASRGEPVIEFGLRRAQGIDGGISASRAAYIGGCSSTSNVLAGKLYGIPVKGTHAHSWVMAFDDEMEAFEGYAEALPNNCLLLVDTYDTLSGVHRAVEIGKKLRDRGQKLLGIRLDSGDLAYLSIEARRILDEAGFEDAVIVGSSDLDEQIIESLKSQGARISVWGVGTKLATAYDQPALGGVYKLGAVRSMGATGQWDGWQPKLKISDQSAKSTIPGILQVRRYSTHERFVGDMIYDELLGIDDRLEIVDPKDATRRKHIPMDAESMDLLQPVVRDGKVVAERETLKQIRQRARDQLARLHPTIRRLLHSHEYPAGLDVGLHEQRDRMIRVARAANK